MVLRVTLLFVFLALSWVTYSQSEYVHDAAKKVLEVAGAKPHATHDDSVSDHRDSASPVNLKQTSEQPIHAEDQQHEHAKSSVACNWIKTKSVDDVKRQQVYKWVDSKGNVHFGDNPNAQQRINDLSRRYSQAKNYFNLNIDSDDVLPPFTHDKINAEVKQIFEVLAAGVYKSQLRQMDFNLKLFKEQSSFAKYRDEFAAGVNTRTGYYSPKKNEAVVWQNTSQKRMLSTIKHEATHMINASLYGNTPIWFNEGMAEYFRDLKIDGQSKQVAPHRYWLKLLNKEGVKPLNAYLQLSWRDWYTQNTVERSRNYAQGWAMSYFLLSNKQGKRVLAELMKTMENAGCDSIDSIAFFESHYPGGLYQYEHDLKAWVSTAMEKVGDRQTVVLASHYY